MAVVVRYLPALGFRVLNWMAVYMRHRLWLLRTFRMYTAKDTRRRKRWWVVGGGAYQSALAMEPCVENRRRAISLLRFQTEVVSVMYEELRVVGIGCQTSRRNVKSEVPRRRERIVQGSPAS